MKKLLTILLVSLLPSFVMAAGGSAYELDHYPGDVSDEASLQRGAQTYMNFCMGCHSLEYGRYNRVARDLDIPEDIFQEHLMFTDAKIGELMTNSMGSEEAKEWFGAPPPDLTLVARVRGTDWLYTYLRNFYVDASRPLGVNNRVFPNVGMPHVMAELQGLCGSVPLPESKEVVDSQSGKNIVSAGCQEFYETGSQTPAEYDKTVEDLVNFLDYMGEPIQQTRKTVGFYVIAFLLVFLVFAILLNREYWKELH